MAVDISCGQRNREKGKPKMGVYRPPPARTLLEQECSSQKQNGPKVDPVENILEKYCPPIPRHSFNRDRRPDQQLYVPKGRRSGNSVVEGQDSMYHCTLQRSPSVSSVVSEFSGMERYESQHSKSISLYGNEFEKVLVKPPVSYKKGEILFPNQRCRTRMGTTGTLFSKETLQLIEKNICQDPLPTTPTGRCHYSSGNEQISPQRTSNYSLSAKSDSSPSVSHADTKESLVSPCNSSKKHRNRNNSRRRNRGRSHSREPKVHAADNDNSSFPDKAVERVSGVGTNTVNTTSISFSREKNNGNVTDVSELSHNKSFISLAPLSKKQVVYEDRLFSKSYGNYSSLLNALDISKPASMKKEHDCDKRTLSTAKCANSDLNLDVLNTASKRNESDEAVSYERSADSCSGISLLEVPLREDSNNTMNLPHDSFDLSAVKDEESVDIRLPVVSSESAESKVNSGIDSQNKWFCSRSWADDSWDNLYDDYGECKNITRSEINTYSEVKCDKPCNNHSEFDSQKAEAGKADCARVIEIYDFPAAFKTQYLLTIFSSFQSSGLDIRWVDDTHALGVFGSASVATQALDLTHPLLKTRSLCDAGEAARNKALKIIDILLPYKPRPETSTLLARRLVSNALGLKVSVPRDVTMAERQKLQNAKDRKKQAAQQREEAWEGTLS